jgi:hypothetical protein
LVGKIGATCSVRALGPNFKDIVDSTFQPQGVVFGHFLGPDSDDAAVSGWSAETHPYRWGGTLLLTKRNGAWKPLWYKSALITRSCEKVAMPDRRDILLCEDEGGGMGHQLHYLYAVDLKRRHDSRENLLIQAVSFSDGCTAQSQVMDPIVWRDGDRDFSVVVRTTEWRRVSATPCNGVVSRRPPVNVQTDFEVDRDGIKKTKAP